MKIRIFTAIVALAILVSGITACTPKGGYLVQVMKLAPEDTYMITCMDAKEAEEDPEFNFIYDYMIDEFSFMMLDMEAWDISALAIIETDWDYIYVLMGDFDLRDVGDFLIELDFAEGEYKGIEIWTDDYDYSVAFIGNMIVAGEKDTVEVCIRRHKNEESSMYDDEDMKAVADKLTAASVYLMFGPDLMYDIEVLSGGIGFKNLHGNDGVLDITGQLKFNNGANAEAAMGNIEDDLSMEFDATSIDAHLSGQFIEFTGEMEIPED